MGGFDQKPPNSYSKSTFYHFWPNYVFRIGIWGFSQKQPKNPVFGDFAQKPSIFDQKPRFLANPPKTSKNRPFLTQKNPSKTTPIFDPKRPPIFWPKNTPVFWPNFNPFFDPKKTLVFWPNFRTFFAPQKPHPFFFKKPRFYCVFPLAPYRYPEFPKFLF